SEGTEHVVLEHRSMVVAPSGPRLGPTGPLPPPGGGHRPGAPRARRAPRTSCSAHVVLRARRAPPEVAVAAGGPGGQSRPGGRFAPHPGPSAPPAGPPRTGH